ncbi:PQQ-binding-like beta-propeller repeat protein [Microlunatus sp. GCM10028923]|uniref:outer membrane protein assembly factor BamB family protein n=1 Tax=Microlunatus sp. GCM10028923 TaxID=3273400 RepID=UPI00360B724B
MTWGTEDGAGRWAPFPVQDWDRLAAEQRGRRRALRPLVVTGLVLALVAALIIVADRIGEPADSVFLPADGTAMIGIRDLTGGGDTERSPVSVETVVLPAPAMIGSTDFGFASRLIAALRDESEPLTSLGRVRLLRSTVTAGPERQTTSVYEVGGDLDLVGEDGLVGLGPVGPGRVYRPGLTELPAGAGPGSTWRDSGSAGAGLGYASDFRAEPAPGHPADCLQTSGRISYTDESGAELAERRVRRVWCPGRGIVESAESVADRTVTVRPGPAPVAEPAPDPGPAPAWPDPRQWRVSLQDPRSISPAYGEERVTGVPSGPPVLTASGRVVRIGETGQDLVVLTTAGSDPPSRSVLRLHPGGRVTGLAAYRGLIIAATSQRRLVGYNDQGLRLWTRDLPEVITGAPVGVAGDRVVLTTIDGTAIAVSLRDGGELWRRSVGARTGTAPVVAGGSVIITGDDGTVTALDPATGEPYWDSTGSPGTVQVLGDTLITVSSDRIEARDLAGGTRTWRLPVPGTLTGSTVVADRLVVATRETTMIMDADGTIRRRLGVLTGLLGWGDLLAGWTADRLMIMDPEGTELAGWPISGETWQTGSRTALATPRGLQLHGAGWEYLAWAG